MYSYFLGGCGNLWNSCSVHNYITLKTDNISYVNALSTIVATVNPNATEGHSKLYYKLCYESLTSFETSELIRCVSNGTTMFSRYRWKESGKAILTVHVYTSSSYNDSDFLDCGTTKVYVANDYGLNLTVQLLNEPFSPNPDTSVIGNSRYIGSSDQQLEDDQKKAFSLGNVTFVPIARLTSEYTKAKYYYRYFFKGPSLYKEEVNTQQPNLTREYLEAGYYHYTLHAIALLDTVLAHHANYSGHFNLLEAVSSTVLQVGNNNSVRVGSREELIMSAEGR